MNDKEIYEKIEKRNDRTPLERVVPLESPYIMFIDPCGVCNFRCKFCPCNMSSFKANDRHQKMSFSLFKKIVNDMQKFKHRVRVVNLYAFGEPLLNEQLPEMISYLKTKNVCNEIRISTNGYCLSPELNQKLVDSGLDLLRISIEAMNESDYEKICGVKIDLNRYIENIKDLYQKSRGKMEVAVKVVNSMIQNSDDEKLFFDTYGKYADYAFRENIDNIWSEFDIGEDVKNKKTHWKTDTAVKSVIHGEKCAYPLMSMVIHSNGLVSACCTDWKFATVYGDVKKTSVYDIWHSEKLRQFQIGHMEIGRKVNNFCSTCIYRSYDQIDDVSDIIAARLKMYPTDDKA